MIVVVGLSHRTAPIAVREKLAVPADIAHDLLQQLVKDAGVGEALLISTCNRVELVAAGREIGADLRVTARAAQDALCARAPGVAPHLYTHIGAPAVEHLFRVAASLDSLVLGEPQILGQVKEAFDRARSAGTVAAALHRAVPRALRAAKRVRTETSIGSGQVSVPSVAVDLARQIFAELRGLSALLVGSGEMAEAVASLLGAAGARLVVVGRNVERTEELARRVSGEPRRWNELESSLGQTDVVITSTSAPGLVIDLDTVQRARRKRRGKTLFFIDLAVPRDVDPRAEDVDGVFLYNIDDFERVVGESLSSRQREAERAESIVREEVRGWERWAEAAQATPTIVALRKRFRSVLHSELERSLRGRLRHLGEGERQALEAMLEASINKMLHVATTKLRVAALDSSPGIGDPGPVAEREELERLAAALNELFALDASARDAFEVATDDACKDEDEKDDTEAVSGRARRRAAGDDS